MRRGALVLATVSIVLASLVVPQLPSIPQAAAQGGVAGTLDPAFDADGIAEPDVTSSVYIIGTAVDAAGRILALVSPRSSRDDQVWRLTAGGGTVQFDPAFHGDGVVNLGVGDVLSVNHFAVRPGGGFVVSGSPLPGAECQGRTGLARFNADGVIDVAFGDTDGGRVLCATWDGFFRHQHLAVDGEDRFVLLGTADGLNAVTRGPGETFTFEELTPIVNAPYRAGSDGEVAVEADGDVVFAVVAGRTVSGSPATVDETVVLVARLREADLTLDQDFNGTGFTTVVVGRYTSYLKLALGPDGSTSVAISLFARNPIRLMEFGPDGDGPGSDDEVPLGEEVILRDLAYTPLGLVAVGQADEVLPHGNRGLAVAARNRREGTVGGTVHSYPDTSLFDSTLLRIGDDILVAGWDAGHTVGNRVFFTRLIPTGDPAHELEIDPTFGEDGFVRVAGDTTDQAQAVVVQPDRKPVIGGMNALGGFVLRQKEDGSLDPTFGVEYGTTPGTGVTFVDLRVLAVARDQSDGAIVAAGSVGKDPDSGAVQRLLADGSPDDTWNGGGPAVWDPVGDGTVFRDVAVQPDGKVVVVGDGRLCAAPPCAGANWIVVARFLRDGSIDATFGSGGHTRVGPVPGASGAAQGRGIVLQPDGRIVVTGSLADRLVVARLSVGGDPDPTFGAPAGPFGPGVAVDGLPRAAGRDVTLRPDGRIVVSGDIVRPLPVAGALIVEPYAMAVQYLPTGARDPAFGSGGLAEIGTAVSQGTGVGVDSRSNVLVGGTVTSPTTGPDILLARLLPGGSPDPAFGTGGLITTHVTTAEVGNDLAIAPDQKIFIAGTHTDTRGDRVLTARYEPGGVLACAPSPLDLGGVILANPPSAGAATCTNVGLSPLTVGGIAVTGANPTDFVPATALCVGTELAPGQSCSIPVTFTPGGVGGRAAVLGVSHSAQGSGSSVPVALSGVGVRRERRLSVDPSSLAFAERPLLGTSPARTLTVTSTGNVPVEVTGVEVVEDPTGDFAKPSSTCEGVSLAPGAICTVTVTFTPKTPGPRAATMRFDHDGFGGPTDVPLRGNGASLPGAVLSVSVNPSSLTFPEQLGLSTSPARTVTVTSSGNAPVTIADVDLTNDPAGDFARPSSTCSGATLAPGATCQVLVTFTPTAPGPRAATLRFDHNGSGAPAEVPVTGSGATPAIVVNPGVGGPGAVTLATGAKFPPNRIVTLTWVDPVTLLPGGFVEPGQTATADAGGSLSAHMVTFPKTRIGGRALLAAVGPFTASTPFLVHQGTVQGPDFIFRN